ncbi:MAG: SGNH/GDSL hydrolase family protein [Planctomycetes bacterium]|nr:SGNH/GDSL hydrolase family protein [Planctomycetota bacterium]
MSLAESWPMRLQEQLRDRLHVPIEVINAGIPGRTSADTIVNLALRVLPLDPDVIIVVHGVNDQKPNRWPGFRDDYSHWYEPPASAAAVLLNSVIDHSLVLAHCRWRIRRLDPGYRDNVRGMLVERHDTVSPVGLEAYRRNLITISGMARAHGVILVLATVGHSLDGNADWQPCDGPNRLLYHHAGLTLQGLKHGFMEYNRVTREVAAEVAAPLVDIERHLPPGEQFFQDDVHFTAAGASRVADLFGELVLWTGWAGEAARSR